MIRKIGRKISLFLTAVFLIGLIPWFVLEASAYTTTPMQVGGIHNTYILQGDGTVWSCGANEYGALGTDSVSYNSCSSRFIQVEEPGGCNRVFN